MKLINRHSVAEKLGLTAKAVSVHVSRRNWNAIPQPAKVGGVYKWVEEDVDLWIRKKFSEPWEEAKASRRRGRPRKK